MEQHQIVDFRSVPDDGELWVVLDGVPSDTWVNGLDRALDERGRSVRPAVADGDRVCLRVDASGAASAVDEYEAVTLLTAYVRAANRAMASATILRDTRPLLADE